MSTNHLNPRPEAKVYCAHEGCGTFLFDLQGQSLVVKARHHGETHVTVLPLGDLLDGLVEPYEPDVRLERMAG